jgi:hypothetical protein
VAQGTSPSDYDHAEMIVGDPDQWPAIHDVLASIEENRLRDWHGRAGVRGVGSALEVGGARQVAPGTERSPPMTPAGEGPAGSLGMERLIMT